MIKKLHKRIFAPLLITIGALASHNAYAFPCQWGGVEGESGSYACADGTNGNDWDDLDGQTIFGNSDWTPITKIDEGVADEREDFDFAVTVASNLNEGTWSYAASIWDTYAEVLIVLKDGKETDAGVPPADVQWSAYLVTPEDNGIAVDLMTIVGMWDMGTECLVGGSAYPCTDNNIPRQISHISLYARGEASGDDDDDTPDIPEPGIMMLLGFGLAGVGMFRIRRRQS